MSSFAFPQGNTRVFTGADAPSQAIGDLNDIYIQENGDVWMKTSGRWKLSAASTKVGAGTVIPADTVGNDGDVFIKIDNGTFYRKEAGVWVLKLDVIASNELSVASGVLKSGSGAISNSTGVDGDFYLRTDNGQLMKRESGAYIERYVLPLYLTGQYNLSFAANASISGLGAYGNPNTTIPIMFTRVGRHVSFYLPDTTSFSVSSAVPQLTLGVDSNPSNRIDPVFCPRSQEAISRAYVKVNEGTSVTTLLLEFNNLGTVYVSKAADGGVPANFLTSTNYILTNRNGSYTVLNNLTVTGT